MEEPTSGLARFQALLQQADQVQANGLAGNTQKFYDQNLQTYEKEMRREFGVEPFPLDIDKMRGFLLHKKGQGRTYSTLVNYISSFSHHFRSNDSENLTLSVGFKMFKSGLKREMLGAKYPNQKEPFEREWFEKLAKAMDLSTFDDRLFFLTITLAYSFFMRGCSYNSQICQEFFLPFSYRPDFFLPFF